MNKKMKIMIDVLINPDRFFREKSKKEVSLKMPFLIVLIMAIIAIALSILILTEMVGTLPKELAPFMSVGAVIGAIGGLIGAFAMWVIYTGIFHTISIAFKGEGRFRKVFEFVGYGFAPSIIGSIIGLVVMIYALPTINFSLEDPELMKQTLLNNQYLQMSRIVNILFLLWSANIWIFGIKYARNLSTRDAAITVSIPVGIYLSIIHPVHDAYNIISHRVSAMHSHIQKTIAPPAILLLLTILLAPMVHADTEIAPTIVVDYTVDPATLMPGDTGTVTITLFNGATDEVVHVTETRSGGNITEMEAFDMNAYVASASLGHDKDSAIAVTSGAYTSVGLIGPSDSVNFVYEIQADEGASDGTHFLRFELIGGSNMEAFRYRIPVKIDSTKLKLVASSIPPTVVRGVSTITLDIVNLRSSNISGVVVTPAGGDLAFNATEFYVGNVPPKASVALTINIDTTSSTAGRKDLTFTARYTNGDTVHESDLGASIEVIDRSILILTGITTEHTSPRYTITGDVNNLGATDLSGVVVAIGAADGVTPKQPYPEYFIGELESDDFGSFEISVELDDGVDSVPLTIEYRDANRAYIVQHESIDIDDSGAMAAGRSSEGMSTGMIALIVLAGLLVIGVIAYSWKQRKDGEKGAEGVDGTDEGDWK